MRLSDVATIFPGLAFRSRIESEASGTFAIVQARDISSDGLVDLGGTARLDRLPAAGRGVLQEGDIVFQPRGARYSVGRVHQLGHPAVAAAPLLIIRCAPAHILPEFLVTYLGLPAVQAELGQSAVGTHVPQIPRQALESLAIELPGLPAQAKLADLADLERRETELLDRLRNARGRLLELAIREVAKEGRERIGAPGSKPESGGAPTPRTPLSKAP